MTLRVALIGNSHLAAPKFAHARNPDRWPGLELTFFGAQSGWLDQTELAGTVLRPINSDARMNLKRINGRARLWLDGHDYVAIVGCELSVFLALRLYRRSRVLGMPSLAEPQADQSHDLSIVSEAAALAALTDAHSDRMAIRLAARIAPVMSGRLMFIEQPRPAARAAEKIAGAALGNQDAAMLNELHRRAMAAATAPYGQLLQQPPETIEAYLLTAETYSAGALRLAQGVETRQPADDVIHANTDYGALVLDQLAAALAGRSQVRSAPEPKRGRRAEAKA